MFLKPHTLKMYPKTCKTIYLIMILTSKLAHNLKPNKKSVIIVGAGAAGIAAARKLVDNQFNVTILEAEPRLGGRIHSVPFGATKVDLGAEWCHGQSNNVVYQMVQHLNILKHTVYKNTLTFSNNIELDMNFQTELNDIFNSIYSPDGDRKQQRTVTVGDYFIDLYNKTITNKWLHNHQKLRIATMCLDTFHKRVLNEDGAFSWHDVAASNHYRNCPGHSEMHWNGQGFKTVLDLFLQNDLEDKIVLNKEVTQIISHNDFVVVVCSDDTVYHADHLIFTPSLGVLKSQHKTLFTPQLSQQKQRAINDLNIAAVHKVILHFDAPWWPSNDSDRISFVWSEEDKDLLKENYKYGPVDEGKNNNHWLTSLASIFKLENNPHAVSVWFSGKFVPGIELMNDIVLVNGIMYAFRQFFPLSGVLFPNNMERFKWYSNPHFKGTYSFQTISHGFNELSLNLELAHPIFSDKQVPRILFAGEATHPMYYSTVHGAIESGLREFNRLSQYYN